ncbi:hypothetical protein HPP92_004341 [Vanilla planifolia]|uniref:Uncharacterized protein n=1 Tax=Vanilla planifolia TaxID=51239 RepID=A0A835RWJ2_VANPL|nr:hypothetical protein HPP92_004341 [Vanilla planifolia]
MASARAWMIVSLLAFLLLARAAEGQTAPTSPPIGSNPTEPHAPENQEEETQNQSVSVPRTEEKNEPTELSFIQDYQLDHVVLGH